MKHFKKMMALVIAMVMVLAMASAVVAAPGDAASDKSVTVSGLDKGDKVQFYQVLKWVDNEGWTLAAGFEGLKNDDGVFKTKLAPAGYTDPKRIEEIVGMIADGISMEEATAIAKYAKDATAKATETVESGSSVTYTIPNGTSNLGLYMAVIGAADPEASYLPVFVSADFNTTNKTETIDASKANHISPSVGAVAKKSKNHVDKTTEDMNSSIDTAIDSKIGMEVDFYVDTVIPVFMETSYKPSYKIDDKITEGIELKTKSIEVKLGDKTYKEGTDYTLGTDNGVFKLTENGTDSYTIVFNENYLLENKAPVKVHVAYKGKVTNTATFNVNEDSNDVTVTYTNGPNGTPSALRDATNHYTFSIGADAFGLDGEEGSTYELIKVSANKDGTNNYETINISTWKTDIKRHALAGATFKLYEEYTDKDNNVPYSNSLYPDGAEFTTGENGIITFKGLEAGTYYLVETNAPDGYIASTTPVKIEISAKYKDVTVPAESKDGVHYAAYSVKVLDSYTVKVNNTYTYNGTSYTYSSDDIVNTYSFVDESAHIKTMPPSLAKVSDGDIINTPGVELPSTGGIGTTIFYVVGAILVVGAGILLVTRRRAGEME